MLKKALRSLLLLTVVAGSVFVLFQIGSSEVNAANRPIPIEPLPPTITVPSNALVINATSSRGSVVDYSSKVSAYDNYTGKEIPLTSVCDAEKFPYFCCTPVSGNNFVLGSTTVTCNAKDSLGQPAAEARSLRLL